MITNLKKGGVFWMCFCVKLNLGEGENKDKKKILNRRVGFGLFFDNSGGFDGLRFEL